MLSSSRRNHISGDMDVRDVAAERGAEREIATGTHVEDGIMKSLYDVAVKGDGALVGYKGLTGMRHRRSQLVPLVLR